ILRPRSAEVHADPPVKKRRVLLVVLVARDTANQNEAAAVDQLPLDVFQPRTQAREREIVFTQSKNVGRFGFGMRKRAIELHELAGAEQLGPARRVRDVAAPPLGARLENTQLARVDGHVLERAQIE